MKSKIFFVHFLLIQMICVYSGEFTIKEPIIQKTYTDGFMEHKIHTDKDGVITKIVSKGIGTQSLISEKVTIVSKNGREYIITNFIDTIKNQSKEITLDNIELENIGKNEYIFRDHYTSNTGHIVERVLVHKKTEVVLISKFIGRVSVLVLRDGSVFSHNIFNDEALEIGISTLQHKYDYTTNGSETKATLYEVSAFPDGDYTFSELYSQNIPIKTLYSNDPRINVLNYLIISHQSVSLTEILSSLIFNENIYTKTTEWDYSASSYLTEGHTEYLPENLSRIGGLPWASNNGYAIGDTITIDMPIRKGGEHLVFYNGYQSDSKPYLFEENSRVRTIKIKCLQTNKTLETIITFLPIGEIVNISSILNDTLTFATIEITVLEVYKGSKYKDLCIQAILPSNVLELNITKYFN